MSVGLELGSFVGLMVGMTETDGFNVPTNVGFELGVLDGSNETVGSTDGISLGDTVGGTEGLYVGDSDGKDDGLLDGRLEG